MDTLAELEKVIHSLQNSGGFPHKELVKFLSQVVEVLAEHELRLNSHD